MLSRSLLTITAEGAQLGMITLTLPHGLLTPPAALAEAVHAGIKAVSKRLKNYATRTAHNLRKLSQHLHKYPDQNQDPAEAAARLEEIEDQIRSQTLGWLAPPPEITVGPNGLHPHYHLLLICPPALQGSQWWKGEKIDGYWRLPDIEADIYAAWTAAALPILRAANPKHAYLYPDPLASLSAEVERAALRVQGLRDLPPTPKRRLALAGAVKDLAAAEAAAAYDSPETARLRGRCVQAVRWSGAAAALAHYTWGAASEIAGAAKRCDLWRCLDSDHTAHLWGQWVEGAKGRRLTRSSRGLTSYLEARAEDCPADVRPPAPEPPRVEVQAHAHPFVLRWARDTGRAEELKAALASKTLPAWAASNLPDALRPLLELRPDLPGLEDYGAPSDPLRDEAAARILRAAQDLPTIGYWVAPDGSIAAPHRPAPCAKRALARDLINSHANPKALARLCRGMPAAEVAATPYHQLIGALYDAAHKQAEVTP